MIKRSCIIVLVYFAQIIFRTKCSARCPPLVVRCGADDSLCDVAKEPRGFFEVEKRICESLICFVMLFRGGVFMVGLV